MVTNDRRQENDTVSVLSDERPGRSHDARTCFPFNLNVTQHPFLSPEKCEMGLALLS